MAVTHEFSGPDGMQQKIRMLASNCAGATEGVARTLLIAVSSPDPVSTPDCEQAGPRGFRIQTLDKDIEAKDIALLLGSMMGFIEQIEHQYAVEFGEEFHAMVDEARDSHGHSVSMSVVPTEPMESKPWKSREGVRDS